jgi:crotonobetainyl-CoA:carnitine CoA-transferase CaiB-like acyl-CoA transferase
MLRLLVVFLLILLDLPAEAQQGRNDYPTIIPHDWTLLPPKSNEWRAVSPRKDAWLSRLMPRGAPAPVSIHREMFSEEVWRARGLQVATATPSKRANGILLAAKRPFQFRCGTPLGAMNGAMIVVDFGSECRMLAAYFPQGKAKVPFFRFCTGEAQAAHNIPFVLPPVTSPI